jgi:cell division protein FtsB
MNISDILAHPFTWGLAVGLFLLCLSLWSHWKTKRELARFQKHLADKVELESSHLESLRKEREDLKKENENLRIKVNQLSEKPEHKLERDLEILARAERHMLQNAPGFAPAWETAKEHGHNQLVEEERGQSFPRKIFRRFFSGGEKEVETLSIESGSSGEGERSRH